MVLITGALILRRPGIEKDFDNLVSSAKTMRPEFRHLHSASL